MPLFGSGRDASLIYHINKELLHRIVDVEVLIYRHDVAKSDVNLYGESRRKVYNTPKLVHALINLSPIESTSDENLIDRTQIVEFAFFKDDLIENDLILQVGDIIEYDAAFWEVDNATDTQYWVGRNPLTRFGTTDHGYSISVVAAAHRTRLSGLDIIDTSASSVTDSAVRKSTPRYL
jgi:hypothetical protein